MPANSLNAGKCLVLVVDDETLVRMDAIDMVEGAGFKTIEASNADEALGLLEAHDDIGILLTDIDMPAGSMNGLRLAATVSTRWPYIRIIVVSGRHRATLAEMPVGSTFLAKPFSQEELTAHLRPALDFQ